jgi:hypothetical protein
MNDGEPTEDSGFLDILQQHGHQFLAAFGDNIDLLKRPARPQAASALHESDSKSDSEVEEWHGIEETNETIVGSESKAPTIVDFSTSIDVSNQLRKTPKSLFMVSSLNVTKALTEAIDSSHRKPPS